MVGHYMLWFSGYNDVRYIVMSFLNLKCECVALMFFWIYVLYFELYQQIVWLGTFRFFGVPDVEHDFTNRAVSPLVLS